MKLDPDDVRRSMEQRTTEELVSILRNHDDEEWRPEVFGIVASLLADRGVSPADVRAMGPEEDVLEMQALVTIGGFLTPMDAQVRRAALEQAGLAAWVYDETPGLAGIGGGALLRVRAEDEQAARAVLEEAPVPASAMPADLAEPPCPKCGSRETFPSVAPVDETDEGPDSPGRTWQYECEACGHVWAD